MNPLEAALREISADLDAVDAKWALVGGLAVSARATPRTTRDVDVAVAVSNDQAAEQLSSQLSSSGYELITAIEQVGVGRLATVRMRRADAALVDLLFASSGIEAEIVAAAERIEILPELTLPVARAGHLMAMKLLAQDDRDRPQDHDDLRALLREADSTEIERCRNAVALIEQRGFARGRDLAERLHALLT